MSAPKKKHDTLSGLAPDVEARACAVVSEGLRLAIQGATYQLHARLGLTIGASLVVVSRVVLSELLLDAETWIVEQAYVDLATFDGSLTFDELVEKGEFHCVGCGVERMAEPAHEPDCKLVALAERLRFAREQVDRAMAESERLEQLVADPPAPTPALRELLDGTHESRPALAKVERVPLRFRLIVDPRTHRARVEPGDEATAAWLERNRDAWLAEQERALRLLDLRTPMTEATVLAVERAVLDVARALDPRAAPVVERYRPAPPRNDP